MERRQVTEIPPVTAEVTEHQLIERECGGCGARTRGKAPARVTAPVQYGPRAAALGTYLWHGQFLSRDRACHRDGGDVRLRAVPGALATMSGKIAGLIAPALQVIARALAASRVAHFDETGFRVAGRLAWVHSASSGKYVLVTVHARRGKQGMDAAGVLPAFGGIACHDAWAPYDSYAGVAGHALCCAHLLRELAAVTETGTADDVIWARQAIDALLALKRPPTPPAPPGMTPSARKSWKRTAGGSATPQTPASSSTPPAAAASSASATPWPPGWPAAPVTTSASPMTCGFPSTTTRPNRSSG